MTSPYIGQLYIFGFNFAPINYAFANGAVLPISQNEALFSILGTTYGGNGVTTYALPDMRDNVAINWGQAPGLTNYTLGQTGGAASVTLSIDQIPTHTHQANAITGNPATKTPTANGWLGKNAPPGRIYSDQPDSYSMALTALGTAGGSQAHSNLQPYSGTNFCIALFGIFPSRN
ncbi:MAG: tail fiber protein [Rhizomicrobium sp.]